MKKSKQSIQGELTLRQLKSVVGGFVLYKKNPFLNATARQVWASVPKKKVW